MKTNLLIFFVVIIFIIANSCTNKNNPVLSEEKEQLLYGTIIDEQGNAIENVSIHYIPIVKEINDDLKKINNPMPSTTIRFSLPQKTVVNMYLLSYGSRDTITYLIKNQILEAGTYSVSLDTYSLKLTCGIYINVLKYDSTLDEKKILLVLSESDLLLSNPYMISDNKGKFIIPYKWFGIGEQFIKIDNSFSGIITTAVSDSISLFFVKDGYENKYEKIKIDTNYTTRKTIILKRK